MLKRNVIIGASLAGAVLVGALIAAACSGTETPDKIDLSTIHTTAAETMAPETSAAPATEAASENPSESGSETSDIKNVSYELASYQDGTITIQYPQVKDMSDADKQEKVNALLKKNALSLLDAWNSEDGKLTLDIRCEVPGVSRKRITAVYTGYASREDAAHPANLFFSNTVDLSTCKDIGFSDYADPYTMAGYVLSDDVQFDGLDAEQTSAVLEDRKTMDIEYYTDIFRTADFPFDAKTTWPSSFSYEKQGVIYFSIPTAHVLGDYAIVKFTPDTK
ncbi:MAG: hypothetical protein Q4F29_04475 [Lachnospiraceae bacterium]|nr:hypothetical protein [Lachnospiraceae bacterium]